MSDTDDFLFDLQGYLVLKQAVSREHIRRINDTIDSFPPLKHLQWHGHFEALSYNDGTDGTNLQNIIEGGECFEELIDHPSWIDHCRRYVGKDDGLYIDEALVSLRGPGEFINIHSGGDRRTIRTQYRYHNGRWHCGQINILMALTEIGPGDGATVVIPASHKLNIPHPMLAGKYADAMGIPGDKALGAIEVHLKAGDAILFVDCLCHGSAMRTNPGQRRILVYRYGPRWGFARFGYIASPELLARLTPQRRQIVHPTELRRPSMVEEMA